MVEHKYFNYLYLGKLANPIKKNFRKPKIESNNLHLIQWSIVKLNLPYENIKLLSFYISAKKLVFL